MKPPVHYLSVMLFLFPLWMKGQITVGDSTSSGVIFYPVYVKLPTQASPYYSHLIDVNNDQIPDLKVEIDIYFTFGGTIMNYNSSIYNLGSIQLASTSTYTNWADTMQVNHLIDSTLNWQSSTTAFILKNFNSPGSPMPYSSGVFNTTINANNFIAFRKKNTNIYGWLNLSPYYSGNNLAGLTVKSFAVAGLQTGIKENDEPHVIKLYPNPANSSLHCELAQKFNIHRVFVKNILGESTQIHDFKATDSFINTSHLPNGVYFIELDTEKGTFSKRFMVSR